LVVGSAPSSSCQRSELDLMNEETSSDERVETEHEDQSFFDQSGNVTDSFPEVDTSTEEQRRKARFEEKDDPRPPHDPGNE
jgi:hypothetical protein